MCIGGWLTMYPSSARCCPACAASARRCQRRSLSRSQHHSSSAPLSASPSERAASIATQPSATDDAPSRTDSSSPSEADTGHRCSVIGRQGRAGH